MIIHVVAPGESIYQISLEYDVPAETIIAVNELDRDRPLVVGQTIVIPGDISSYTVQRGDTMYGIAKKFGVSVKSLLAANPRIANPAKLAMGQRIIIPAASGKLRPIYVNGYSYPGIPTDILQSTLPYLTYLSIFSYEVKADGGLIPIDDAGLIQKARSAGIAPLMVLTSTAESRVFLKSEALQDMVITNILAVLEEKNYYGLDVDFEYIVGEDRENFTNFIRKIANTLKPMGYLVSMAVAPKTSATQKGLLYEGIDYAALGALVDQITVMTYEWGYTYGPAMAVSPIDQVKRVLDYAVTVIPSEKILMGMPNYGYDWILPFVKGTPANKLTNDEALWLAARVGANIVYSDVSQAPYFNYYDNMLRRHEVWFEDARSTYAKLKLVDTYNLRGVSYWNVSEDFYAVNWLVLESMYDVVKVI